MTFDNPRVKNKQEPISQYTLEARVAVSNAVELRREHHLIRKKPSMDNAMCNLPTNAASQILDNSQTKNPQIGSKNERSRPMNNKQSTQPDSNCHCLRQRVVTLLSSIRGGPLVPPTLERKVKASHNQVTEVMSSCLCHQPPGQQGYDKRLLSSSALS